MPDDPCEGLSDLALLFCNIINSIGFSEAFHHPLEIVRAIPPDIKERVNKRLDLMPKASLVDRTIAVEQVLRENQFYDAAFQMSLIIPQFVDPSDRSRFTTIRTTLENRASNLEKLGRTSEAKDIRTVASYVGSPRSRSKKPPVDE